MYDPFGYYIPKAVAGSHPDPHFVYMEDFPINDSSWNRDAYDPFQNLEDDK